MTKRERGRPPREIPGKKCNWVIDADLAEWVKTHDNQSAIVNLALRSLKEHNLTEQDIYKLLSTFGNE
jgi:hypothetical protein